jgi:hypothetical protein
MWEPLRVEALADTVAAEPASGLAESRLDVGRRERPQRIGFWIDVSRFSHGQVPLIDQGRLPDAHSRITGSVAHARSPSRLAPRGKAQEGQTDEGGRDGYRGIEFGQKSCRLGGCRRTVASKLMSPDDVRLLPRSGSRVRIPSPAPIFFKQISELKRSFGVVFCFPVSDAKAGEAGGGSRLRRNATGSRSASASFDHQRPAERATMEAGGLLGKRRPQMALSQFEIWALWVVADGRLA